MAMFPRWRKGQRPKLSADGWNAAMLAAESHHRTLRGGLIPGGVSVPSRTLINVRNTTGQLQTRASVLGLGSFTFDPNNAQQLDLAFETLALDALVPASGTHDDKFVILTADLDKGEIGEAVLGGLALAGVNVTDATHKFATIDNGNTATLKSAGSGRAKILASPGTTGLVWAIVELAPQGLEIHRGITLGVLNKGSSASVTRYLPGTTTDSGITDTVNNELANVGSGKVIYYARDGANLYVFAAECPLV